MARTRQQASSSHGRPGKNLVSAPPSSIKQQEIDLIKRRYNIPPSFNIRVPTRAEYSPYVVTPGSFAMYEAAMDAGVRFPMNRFAMQFLRENNLVPCQLHPNAWLVLVAFSIICHIHGVPPSLPLFGAFYRLRRSKGYKALCLQKIPGTHKLFTKPPNKLIEYETRWFVVEPPRGWPVPVSWSADRLDNWQELPRPTDLAKQYVDSIQLFCPPAEIDPESLITPEGLAVADWGVGPTSSSQGPPPEASAQPREPHVQVSSSSSSEEGEVNVAIPSPYEGFGCPIRFESESESESSDGIT